MFDTQTHSRSSSCIWTIYKYSKVHCSGFSDERVRLKGHIDLKIVFGLNEITKVINGRYLVVGAPSSYNIIIGWFAFKLLGTALSTLYLSMKYLLPNRKVGVFNGNQETVQECYQDNLWIRKVDMATTITLQPGAQRMNFVNLDPIIEPKKERLKPEKYMHEVHIEIEEINTIRFI